MTGRPTPERIADIRMFATDGRYPSAVDDLLAELDALTRERDEAREWRDVWGDSVNYWQRVYAEAVGQENDAALGRIVRQLARSYYESTVPASPHTTRSHQ